MSQSNPARPTISAVMLDPRLHHPPAISSPLNTRSRMNFIAVVASSKNTFSTCFVRIQSQISARNAFCQPSSLLHE